MDFTGESELMHHVSSNAQLGSCLNITSVMLHYQPSIPKVRLTVNARRFAVECLTYASFYRPRKEAVSLLHGRASTAEETCYFTRDSVCSRIRCSFQRDAHRLFGTALRMALMPLWCVYAMRFREYYKGLFFGPLDMPLVNASIVPKYVHQKKSNKVMSHNDFLSALHTHPINQNESNYTSSAAPQATKRNGGAQRAGSSRRRARIGARQRNAGSLQYRANARAVVQRAFGVQARRSQASGDVNVLLP